MLLLNLAATDSTEMTTPVAVHKSRITAALFEECTQVYHSNDLAFITPTHHVYNSFVIESHVRFIIWGPMCPRRYY